MPRTKAKATTSEPAAALQMVPLDKITPSPTNPRRTFDAAALDQLAASVKEKGVLEPVLLRPRRLRVAAGRQNGKPGFLLELLDQAGKPVALSDDFFKTEAEAKAALPLFELVAGERRVRAAKLAGLTDVPALVRELDDRQAAEIAVVENDQREDVPPLEQAKGYERLVGMGLDAETIAAKIGRPARYVAGRLQLTHLTPELQEDLAAGLLPFGHAWVLSRLTPADQTELRESELYGQDWQAGGGKEAPLVLNWSLAELKREVRRVNLHSLSAAPWKKDDAALVPEAGACKTCPKRSGSRPDLFDEILNGDGQKKPKDDFCTDGACYRSKKEAFVQLQLRTAAEKAGGEEPLKVTDRFWSNDKAVLGKDRYEEVSAKEAKAGGKGVQVAVVTEGDTVGRIVHVRMKKARAASSGGGTDWKAQERAHRKKALAGRAAAAKAMALVAAEAERSYKSVTLEPPSNLTTLLRELAWALPDMLGHDICRSVAKRRGLGEKGDYPRDLLQDAARKSDDGPHLFGFVAEMAAAHKAFDWGSAYSGDPDKDHAKFWAAWGVDPKALIAEANAGDDGEKPAKAKPGRKKKAAKAGV